jgi:hypothetical protein
MILVSIGNLSFLKPGKIIEFNPGSMKTAEFLGSTMVGSPQACRRPLGQMVGPQ